MRTKRLNVTPIVLAIGLFVLVLALTPPFTRWTEAGVANLERVNVGTGGVQANYSSYFGFPSYDGRYVTFESYADNWYPDQDGNDNCFGNCVDVFVRDRLTDVTTKITAGHDGSPADDDSVHPIITADGRYVAYTSYATNLVPGDTNSEPWVRNGLDVFLFDRQTGQTRRVSLNWTGAQIWGNSVGGVTGDGRFIVFASDGTNVLKDEPNLGHVSNIYMRLWQTGEIWRITADMNTGGFPNGEVREPQSNHDGRYVVYVSNATNLTVDPAGGIDNVFLYDRLTGVTKLLSKPVTGGVGNGPSTPAQISGDGRYVVFRSEATNLVPGDTNGVADIFVYTVATGQIERVTVSDSGEQANARSRDPFICYDGSAVSFSSRATNLVPGDTNGERDVFFRDLNRDRIAVATLNQSGEWGNAISHRSFLSGDCRSVVFATEASNILPDDTNGVRDIFMAAIVWPADFATSSQSYPAKASPGSVITYTVAIRNSGTEAAAVTFTNPIPAGTTYAPGWEAGGVQFDAGQNRLTWSGTVQGESEHSVQFGLLVDPGLSAFTLISNQATLTSGAASYFLHGTLAVNGSASYLPIMVNQW